jgi:hypothetical protein
MNPVGQEGNIFNSLFDKVPAKRAGGEEDIAGVVIYLASKGGVNVTKPRPLLQLEGILTI